MMLRDSTVPLKLFVLGISLIHQAELARRHSCSQGEIANTIRLLELPEDIQGKIISQKLRGLDKENAMCHN